MQRRAFITGGTAALAVLGLASCYQAGGPPPHAPAYGYDRGGPPPHAPAHGYRFRHQRTGVDLVFDSGLGVYVVVGYPYYYHRERFFRYYDGVWQASLRVDGGWIVVADREVPETLYRARTQRNGKPGRGRGRGPGKAGPPGQAY
jgi:hypothetical protein